MSSRINYLQVVQFIAAMLLGAAVNALDNPRGVPVEAHRMNSAAVRSWLDSQFRNHVPVRFFSNNGVWVCCDVGNTEITLESNGTFSFWRDGYVPTVYRLSYVVNSDGRIAAQYPDATSPSDDSDGSYSRFFHLNAFSSGPSVFLSPSDIPPSDVLIEKNRFFILKFSPHSRWSSR